MQRVMESLGCEAILENTPPLRLDFEDFYSHAVFPVHM